MNSGRESVPVAGWPYAVFQERPSSFQSYFLPGGAAMAPIFYAIVQAAPGLLI
jgi:acyl-CoA thioesterase